MMYPIGSYKNTRLLGTWSENQRDVAGVNSSPIQSYLPAVVSQGFSLCQSESKNRAQSPFRVHLKSEKALPVRLTVLSQGPTSDVYFARQLANMSGWSNVCKSIPDWIWNGVRW